MEFTTKIGWHGHIWPSWIFFLEGSISDHFLIILDHFRPFPDHLGPFPDHLLTICGQFQTFSDHLRPFQTISWPFQAIFSLFQTISTHQYHLKLLEWPDLYWDKKLLQDHSCTLWKEIWWKLNADVVVCAFWRIGPGHRLKLWAAHQLSHHLLLLPPSSSFSETTTIKV